MRTSFTSIVREAGDLSAGVFDRRGYMIAQAVTGTPGHINSMAPAMKHFLAAYPIEPLRPGDVLITNDPWKTSGHLNDVTVVHSGLPRAGLRRVLRHPPATAPTSAAACSRAEAREVYEEGLFIPIMKLYDAAAGSTTRSPRSSAPTCASPDEVLGDFHAQVAGGNRRRASACSSSWTSSASSGIEPLADEIISRTERGHARGDRRASADGDYRYCITSDGFDEPITHRGRGARSRATISLVDYTGSSPASRRGHQRRDELHRRPTRPTGSRSS